MDYAVFHGDIGFGVNLALQTGLTAEDLEMLLS